MKRENCEEYYGECQWLINKGTDDVKLKNGIHNTIVPHNEVGEKKKCYSILEVFNTVDSWYI